MTPTDHFKLGGRTKSITPYGNGHINNTKLVIQEENGKEFRYILQQINTEIFKYPEHVMENIGGVTAHIREKVQKAGGNPERETLTVVETCDGGSLYQDAEGCWRMYRFVEGGICLERVETPEDFFESAVAFGRFQRYLSDYPIGKLHTTIPDFHNTTRRFADFEEAVKRNVCGRRAEVEREIEFALARREECCRLDKLQQEGKLPIRVTHNDTKLNNVMLDAATRKALCVIDLDTVMPGLAAHDFGDAIRFGANTAAEDETDLAKVNLDMDLYRAYLKGFLQECGADLTELEKETLSLGAKIMTMECGIRFLGDYLSGDTYFKIHREKHNLDRARNQFKLVESMERQWKDMSSLLAMDFKI